MKAWKDGMEGKGKKEKRTHAARAFGKKNKIYSTNNMFEGNKQASWQQNTILLNK